MDFFNSFFQNVKDKLTSPFFGTLAFILIFHHWEFWYTLFNFDKDCTRIEKLAILQSMARKEFGLIDLLADVGIATVFVLVGYGVVFCTKTLSLAFDYRAMVWITGKVVSDKVVPVDDHNKIVKERDKYADQYEDQRQRVRLFSKNLDEQTNQIQEKDKLILSEGRKVNDLNKTNTDLQSKVTLLELKIVSNNLDLERIKADVSKINLENEKIREYVGRMEKELFGFKKILFSPNQKFKWTSPGNLPVEVISKVNKLQEDGLWSNFLQLANAIQNGGIYSEDQLKELEPLEVFTSDLEPKLTALGQMINYYKELFIPSGWQDRL